MKEKSKKINKNTSSSAKTKSKIGSELKSKTNGATKNKNAKPNKKVATSDSKKSKVKPQSSKLAKILTTVCISILILGGVIGGYFIWQNNIFYTISFAQVEGIEIIYNTLSVKKRSDFSFKIELKEDFTYYDELFQVKANGIKLEEVEQEYTIKNVKENIEISIVGVGTDNLQIENKTFSGSNSTSASLVIPYGVETIAKDACPSNNTITKLVIPNSVKSIGDKAFYSCVNLTEITMGKNVERIGEFVFEYTAWLNNKSDGYVYLENWIYSFKNHSTLVNLIIKEGIVGIASNAFTSVISIQSIEMPNSLKYICDNVFISRTFTELNLPANLEYIGFRAFATTHLQELNLPSSLI